MLRLPTLRTLAVLGAAGLALAGVPVAYADDEDSAKIEVVAKGLDNPRGLSFGPDGALYVAEAGAGGTGPCLKGPEGDSCYGKTGAVTRVATDSQERVLDGLSSLAAKGTGASAIGPSDVAFGRFGRMQVTVGLGLPTAVAKTVPQLADMGELIRANGASGTWSTVADLAQFEDTSNPTGDEKDSNPNSVVPLRRGFVVVDAGGNDVLQVGRAGAISVLATFPKQTFGGATFQAVPTSVTVGPDGAVYVGQLTGFPFPVGAANVYRIKDGKVAVFASGFTNIIDIGFDADDNLYVLEIAENGLTSGDPTGALLRVDEDGHKTLVTDDLTMPGGLAIRGDDAYVSNYGTFVDRGEVVKIDLGD